MTKIDINKLDSEQKIRILKKVTEKYGLSYVAQKLGVIGVLYIGIQQLWES